MADDGKRFYVLGVYSSVLPLGRREGERDGAGIGRGCIALGAGGCIKKRLEVVARGTSSLQPRGTT